ncbi:MAG: sigma 54-interacting transcriptional regulator [Nannocystaceae bacterium]
MFESELFGYEKGAFTGAQQSKPGLIETADGGTVFLDELWRDAAVDPGEAAARDRGATGHARGQPARARGRRPLHRRDEPELEKEIELGNFREDLFYRLNGISLVIPPLRERLGELQGLARSFIAEACKDAGFASQPVLSRDSVDWMLRHAWPGNIRELRNAINRAVLLATGGVIQPEHMRTEAYAPRTGRGSGRTGDAPAPAPAPVPVPTVPSSVAAPIDPDEEERQRIMAALAACGGNQTRAAKVLGIARRTLTSKLGKLGRRATQGPRRPRRRRRRRVTLSSSPPSAANSMTSPANASTSATMPASVARTVQTTRWWAGEKRKNT